MDHVHVPDQPQHESVAVSRLTSARLDRRRFLRRSSVGVALPALALASLPATEVSAQDPAATPAFDPLPEVAQGPVIPETGYLTEDLGGGLYAVTDGIYQMMFAVTGEGVIVVDAPPTIGQRALLAIAEVTEEPITHVIYSHTHADHIGAASLYPADSVRIAHERAVPLLEAVDDPHRPLPTQTFADSYTLQVGSQTLQLEYKGANHSPDNIFVWAPAQEVLLLIDVIFPGWAPFKELAISQDIPGWIGAHDQILEYPFRTLVSGHLGRLGARADVETQRDYIADLRANAEQAIAGVDFMPIAQEVGFGNIWVLFDAYLDALIAATTEPTLAAWRGKLGGVDVFTADHAWKMIESLRVDYGQLGPFGLAE